MSPAEQNLQKVLSAYDLGAPVLHAERYGSGHINDTFCITTQEEPKPRRYILQRVSSAAFPRPELVMHNMIGITSYLRQHLIRCGEDAARGTLTLVPAKDGKLYYIDVENQIWRMTHFIEHTSCLQSAQTPQQFYASARAFGRFQRLLGDYPANTLYETIERFHDTENRLNNLKLALAQDKLHRAQKVQPEIDFALARRADCSVCMQALRDGVLPLRVTHNDTKLNNVLFDESGTVGICVIDLDTVMPGLSINDFGDSIRFGANHNAEDEKDLSKVAFDITLYEAYTKGFLAEAAPVLTQSEIDYMPWGAKLMTLECGIRFLTDYLNGDVYFHTQYEGQNLDRCRTQFKLVADMEQVFSQMHEIALRCAKESN